MSSYGKSWEYVEKQIRKKTFGILGTVSPKGRSHTSGIVYGVSPPKEKFRLYILTKKDYFKVKNIQKNHHVSMTITYPHYWLRFVPAATIYFQATAKLLPFDSFIPQEVFKQKRILRLILPKDEISEKDKESYVFIEIKPKKIICHGVGIGLLKQRKNHEHTSYFVQLLVEKH
ncbi:MAG: pyridoxamine 5'-phosphate oxidase family protein [Candidatus Heimdallarchaeota archaeon]|nr:pyridoxamine 5'-phosphate oxidase family protein [Candidatus Heimdallarchaeota archaeon]MBY8995996.1 pyridoxamine 5'-phosphate oxidase family protein [Candidatus Heimdallarchaeota archaeon]